MILLRIHGDWRPNIMKNFIVSFYHRKSIMHQKDTINEEHKIIKNKYILNNTQRAIWRFNRVIIEEP
jgi:hypothetical protein